jgi:exopolyphosphatase/guanosine-5'-triphosphate,3'-diphosphate pyrophosphatase
MAPKKKLENLEIAVVDIGSFTIRLVIYKIDSQYRLTPIINEKVTCGLVNGLDKNNHLSDESIKNVLKAIKKFATVLKEHQPDKTYVLATAAVREAENGSYLAEEIEQLLKAPVQVLAETEEARYAAYAVLQEFEEADGLVGDLGGGSMELAYLSQHHVQDSCSLPLGHLRLRKLLVEGLTETEVTNKVVQKIKKLSWLQQFQPYKNFYAIGGRWRELGKLYAKTKNPKVIDANGRILIVETQHFKNWIETKIMGQPKWQTNTVYPAALAMLAVLKMAGANKIIIMPSGIREGFLWHQLKLEF